jgi:transcriptional regulator with XRE-family HTH domain
MGEGSSLGDRLRRLRRERSVTQEELAHLAGVSAEMIAKTEQGRRHPRVTVWAKLAQVLDVPLSGPPQPASGTRFMSVARPASSSRSAGRRVRSWRT